MKSNRWRALVVLAAALVLPAIILGAAIAPPVAVSVSQDLAADTINITTTGNGIGPDKNTALGFKLNNEAFQYGFKTTVTRANVDAMDKSKIKQDTFLLVRYKIVKDGKTTYATVMVDKDHPQPAVVKDGGWEGPLKAWEKDGAVDLLVLDENAKKQKIDGTPAQVKASYPAAEPAGKQFYMSDFPGAPNLATVNGLVEVTHYRTFRITSELNGKTITAVFKMQVVVEKVGGNWKEKTATTDPKLPHTWPDP